MKSVTDIAGLLEIMKTLKGEQTQKEYAHKLGVSAQYLNDVFNSRRDPGAKILEPLGISRGYIVPETILNTVSASTTTMVSTPQENTNASIKESRKEINSKARRKR